jgi:hypothetical protein
MTTVLKNQFANGREVFGFLRSPSTEPFIDPDSAAEFVKLNRKTLLRLARQGVVPAHPLAGNRRKKWRFLVSELDSWARARVNSTSDPCHNSRRK